MNKIIITISIILTIICGIIGGCIGNNIRNDLSGKIPLIFSEISQIKRNYAKDNLPVPALTIYYALVNDIAMKVFEANNQAYKRNVSHTTFAKELEYKMDPTFRVHMQIGEIADGFTETYNNALIAINEISVVGLELKKISDIMDSVWAEDHRDQYHTESYTTTDSKGNTSTHYREVYDYTDHTFTCNVSQGRLGLKMISETGIKFPSINIEELQPRIINTGIENEDVISNWATENKKLIDSDTAKKKVLENFNNSTLSYYRQKIITQYGELITDDMNKYMGSLLTAKRIYTYRTYSHNHSGPAEFQIWKQTLNKINNINSNITTIIRPIIESNKNVQKLKNDINEYIAVVLDGKDGDASDLRDSILDGATNLYLENYCSGLKIQTYGIWVSVLSVFISVLIGALISLVLFKIFKVEF